MPTRSSNVYDDTRGATGPAPALATTVLTLAEIKALKGTPIDIASISSSGQIIEFVAATLILNTGLSGFITAGNTGALSGALTIGSGTTAIWSYASPTALLQGATATAPKVVFTDGPNVGTHGSVYTPSTTNPTEALKIWNASPNANYEDEAGTSQATLTVRCFYRVHNLS